MDVIEAAIHVFRILKHKINLRVLRHNELLFIDIRQRLMMPIQTKTP